MDHIPTVGVIGLGSFGGFIASLLSSDYEIHGFDTREDLVIPAHIKRDSLQAIASLDIIILATPLSEMPTVLQQLSALISPTTLVVDVCSVKMKPEALFAEYLPEHENILLTHPLFGPQSAIAGTAGCKLIVAKSQGEQAEHMLTFFQNVLQLDIYRQTSEEHDRIMAQVHALTFFVARGLRNMQLPAVPFKTPSYDMILSLINFDTSHSEELFQTIESGNPFAEEARRGLVESFNSLEDQLRDASLTNL